METDQWLRLSPLAHPIDPLKKMKPTEYGDIVLAHNNELRERAGVLLRAERLQLFPAHEHVKAELYLNGSDGRGENFSSPLEPIVILDTPDPNILAELERHRDRLENFLTSVVGYTLDGTAHIVPHVFDGRLEIKSLQRGNLSYYIENGEKKDLWPSRVVDASPLLRSEASLLPLAKEAVANEMRGGLGKKILEREKDRLRRHRQISESGKQTHKGQDITHFDLNEGVAYYDKGTDSILRRSFKYGPLRMVQTFLLQKAFQATRERDDGIAFLQRVPANTALKTQKLHSEGILNTKEKTIDELVELYLYFLRLYHVSEYESVLHGESEVEIQDLPEVRENLSKLNAMIQELRAK